MAKAKGLGLTVSKNITVEGVTFKTGDPLPETTSVRIQRYLKHVGVLETIVTKDTNTDKE